MSTYLLRIAGGKQDVPNALKRFRVGFLGKAKNDRITVDYMILPVGITVSRRKVLCDLRKLVNHRSALSFDLSEFHRQGILAALAVVGHIDGKNVFLPSGQFGRIGIVEKTSLSILLGKIKSATLMCKIKIALSKLSEKTFLVNDLLSEQNPLTHLKIGW